jgi:hypothetical protein
LNYSSYPEPESTCGFGSAGFVPSESKTFKVDADKNFNISYGGGEFLTGTVGFDTVTVGGLTVTSQEIALVTTAAWPGDLVSSGILGLSLPHITSVYNGTDPDNDTSANLDPYNPFFFTAVQEGVVKNPYFSVALDRGSLSKEANSTIDPHLGYLSFGGIAPVAVTDKTVTVPVEPFAILGTTSPELIEYFVNVTSYNFKNASQLTGSGKQVFFDTGSPQSYLPSDIVNGYAAEIDPPAQWDYDEGGYVVDCNATAPAFSVTIGGVDFSVSEKDMIVPWLLDNNGEPICVLGMQPAGSELPGYTFILGDPFMHNVVLTFNIKKLTVTLTQRPDY